MITNHLSTNFPKDVVMRHRSWLSRDEIVVLSLFSSDSQKTSCPKPSHGMTRNTGCEGKGAIKGKKKMRKTGCDCLTCRMSTLRNMQVLVSVFSDSPQVLTFSFILTQVRTLQCFLKGDLSHGKIQLLLMCCHNICDSLCTEPSSASGHFFVSLYLHCVLSIYLPL